MKNKIKHLFFVLVVIASLFVILPIESNAATSGTCGDNLTWTLDDSGTLTISGTGDMTDLSEWSSETCPWYNSVSQIKSVVISDGVTSIGDYSFPPLYRSDKHNNSEQRYKHWRGCILLLYRADRHFHSE